MKVIKQSLKDWEVTEDGKHVAWITKVSLGYEVTFKGNDFNYFKPSFKEAKEFATQ